MPSLDVKEGNVYFTTHSIHFNTVVWRRTLGVIHIFTIIQSSSMRSVLKKIRVK